MPSDAIWHHRSWSILLWLMAWHIFCTKPLLALMVTSIWTSGTFFSEFYMNVQWFSFNIIHLKIPWSAKWEPFGWILWRLPCCFIRLMFISCLRSGCVSLKDLPQCNLGLLSGLKVCKATGVAKQMIWNFHPVFSVLNDRLKWRQYIHDCKIATFMDRTS